eukprot:934967_1
MWQDEEAGPPGGSVPEEMKLTLDGCQTTHGLILALQHEIASARERITLEYTAREKSARAFVATLNGLLKSKLDELTLRCLQYPEFDEMTSEDVMIQSTARDLGVGLWASAFAGDVVAKSADFGALGVNVDLPRAFTMAVQSRMGMRAVAATHDFISSAVDSPGAFAPYGRVYVIDLVELPPPSQKWKDLRVRAVTASSERVTVFPYGPSDGEDKSSYQCICVSFRVAPNLFIDSDPLIGWWDEAIAEWRTDDIGEIKYDPTERIVSFETLRLKPFSLVNHRDVDFPYDEWILSPAGSERARLTVQSRRETIEFEIVGGECQLIKAPPQLDHLKGLFYRPGHLLLELSRCGLNFLPSDLDARALRVDVKRTTRVQKVVKTDKEGNVAPVEAAIADPNDGGEAGGPVEASPAGEKEENSNKKEEEKVTIEDLELRVHEEIASIAPSFEVSESKWNLESGTEKCFVKIRKP